MSAWWRILIWSRKCQSDQAVWYLGNTICDGDNRLPSITASPCYLPAPGPPSPTWPGLRAGVDGDSGKTSPRQKRDSSEGPSGKHGEHNLTDLSTLQSWLNTSGRSFPGGTIASALDLPSTHSFSLSHWQSPFSTLSHPFL